MSEDTLIPTPSAASIPEVDIGNNFNFNRLMALREAVSPETSADNVVKALADAQEEKPTNKVSKDPFVGEKSLDSESEVGTVIPGKEDADEPEDDTVDPEDVADDAEDDTVEAQDTEDEEDDSPKDKLKYKDKELDIPLEAVVTVKINGKEEQVSFKDLKSGFIGNADVQRRFTQLDKEKKSFYSEMNEARKYIELVATLPPEQAIYFIAKQQGRDPLEVQAEVTTKIIEEVQALQKMTPTERQLRNKLAKLEAEDAIQAKAKEIEARIAEQTKKTNTKETRNAQLYQLLDDTGVSQDEFQKGAEYIVEKIVAGELEEAEWNEERIIHALRAEKVLNVMRETAKIELSSAPKPEYERRLAVALEAEEKMIGRFLTAAEVKTVTKLLIDSDRAQAKKLATKKTETVGKPSAHQNLASNASSKSDAALLNKILTF
jgi:hypothetical protein